MESYEVQLKDFKKAEQELTGKERVFISQDNNTRSTTIDEIRKPLAEQLNEKVNLNKLGNSNKLLLDNCYGNTQNIHPKVIKLDTAINGYTYWMAYTPYPQGSLDKENPSIACSKNAIDWVTPSGLINPIVDTPTENTVNGEKAYNSDTHLLYVNEKFEVWYRYANETTNEVKIYRILSADGVNWGTPQLIITTNLNDGGDMLSPAIIHEDNKYKVWSVSRGSVGYNVQYIESSDLITWSENKFLNIDFGTRVPWHMDIIKSDDLGYELLVQCKPSRIASNSEKNVLMYTKTTDNINFDKAVVVLEPSYSYGAFDGLCLYRSSLIKMYGRYYIYYSGIGYNGERGMGLAIGEDITKLKYANLNMYESMKMNYGVKNTSYKHEFANSDGFKACLRFSSAKEMEIVEDFSLQNLINLLVKELSVRNSKGNRSTIKSSEDASSTIQSTRTLSDGSTISGGLQAGIIYLDDSSIGLSNGLTLKEGAVRYNATTKNIEVYNGSIWVNSERGLTKTITAPATIENYDVSNVKTIIIMGNGAVEFKSFTGGYIGQSINIILGNGTSNVLFKYSTNMITPSLTDYSLTIDQLGATMVFTNTNIARVMK